MKDSNLPSIKIPKEVSLPDSDQWQNRFEIRSESSDRIYIVSQNIKKKHWACSCPGWKRFRKCKHLDAIGLPNFEKPYEPIIER